MSEERLQSEVIRYISLQYPNVRYCASLGGIYTGPRQKGQGIQEDFQIYNLQKQGKDSMHCLLRSKHIREEQHKYRKNGLRTYKIEDIKQRYVRELVLY